jgi:hypothetical protein
MQIMKTPSINYQEVINQLRWIWWLRRWVWKRGGGIRDVNEEVRLSKKLKA